MRRYSYSATSLTPARSSSDLRRSSSPLMTSPIRSIHSESSFKLPIAATTLGRPATTLAVVLPLKSKNANTSVSGEWVSAADKIRVIRNDDLPDPVVPGDHHVVAHAAQVGLFEVHADRRSCRINTDRELQPLRAPRIVLEGRAGQCWRPELFDIQVSRVVNTEDLVQIGVNGGVVDHAA